MRLGAIGNRIYLLLLMFCSTLTGCGQSESEKIKLHNMYVDKATVLRMQGDLNGAIVEQSKAVGVLPENPATLAVLAGFYLDRYEDADPKQREDLLSAKQLLEKAIKINDGVAIRHEMLSAVLELLGEKEAALQEMEAAIRLEPDNLDNMVNLAVRQQSVGDIELAKETFESILKKNPDYIYALYHFAEAEVENGNIVNAKSIFKKIISFEKHVKSRDLGFIADSKKALSKLAEYEKTRKLR